jgi:hypothetical protein
MTHILVDAEHLKVDRLGPFGIIKDIVCRDVKSSWFLVLWVSLVATPTQGTHTTSRPIIDYASSHIELPLPVPQRRRVDTSSGTYIPHIQLTWSIERMTYNLPID